MCFKIFLLILKLFVQKISFFFTIQNVDSEVTYRPIRFLKSVVNERLGFLRSMFISSVLLVILFNLIKV